MLSSSSVHGLLVPAAKLDDLLTPPVHLLKVDAQFTDHRVVRGAGTTIAASPEIAVIVEFGPQELERRGEGPEGILAYYRQLGFDILLLEGNREPRPIGDDEIMSAGPYLDLLLERSG